MTADQQIQSNSQITQRGAVCCSHGGKLHPAIIDPLYGMMIVCRCPGTQNGSAYGRNALPPSPCSPYSTGRSPRATARLSAAWSASVWSA